MAKSLKHSGQTIAVNLDYLLDFERRCEQVHSELGRLSFERWDFQRSPSVATALEDFGGRWEGNREEIRTGVRQLTEAVRLIRESFADTDADLERSLLQEGEEGAASLPPFKFPDGFEIPPGPPRLPVKPFVPNQPESSSPGWPAPGLPLPPIFPPQPGFPRPEPPSWPETSGNGESDSGQPQTTPGWDPDMADQQRKEAAERAYKNNADAVGLPADYRSGAGYGDFCTSWVQFRIRELGLVPHGTKGGWGHGGEMAGLNPEPPADGILRVLGFTRVKESSELVPGAIASTWTTNADYGHAMVVESVQRVDGQPTQITISEMNYVPPYLKNDKGEWIGNGIYSTRTYVDLGDGRWQDVDNTNTEHVLTFANPPS